MITVKAAREALAKMPDDAVLHLCVEGLSYLAITRLTHEANDDGEPGGVVLVEPDQAELVAEIGLDGPIRELLAEIRDNYDEHVIAHQNATAALALLDGVGARIRPADEKRTP